MKHFDALLHVTGKSIFTADIPEPEGTLFAVVFCSTIAHGKILSIDTSVAEKMLGVKRIITAKDIPGENEIGNIVMDEVLLAEKTVHFIGEPIAIVLASSKAEAQLAKEKIIVKYKVEKAISSAREAAAKGLLIVPPRIFSTGDAEKALGECKFIVKGNAETGGQEHLYLETQTTLCIPEEGRYFKITSSTQSPSFVQKIAARVLNLPINAIQVDVLRLGGAFGGKEDQATPWAVMAALGSYITGKPVKLVLSRHEDLVYTGKRHPYSSDYTIGLNKDGKILSWKVDYYQNSGAVSDLSTAILERSLFHSTSSYFIPNVTATGYCCRTNLAPNTAFRGFGGPQAMFVMEAAIHKAAKETGFSVETIQQINLLKKDDTFPYGMTYPCNEAVNSWAEVEEKSDFYNTKTSIHNFNKNSKYIKKGISFMPVCFGISFTTTFLNQANALVHVYTDGSVGISTGAVEMGQGVNSRMRQVAQGLFSIPIDLTRVESTNTTRSANTSPTAASSGADMNGNATRIACENIRTRLLKVASEELGAKEENLMLKDSFVWSSGQKTDLTWNQLVQKTYFKRISLSCHAHYATPGIHFNQKEEKGKPFAYHVVGTAVTEVSVDCLLGSYNIDKVTIVHKGGKQLNPLVDRGQVEGALLQGIGWVTMEELKWDEESKRLLSDTLATYKIPDINFTPDIIDIHFSEGEKLDKDVGLKGSKAIGEPPFMYGIGSYFAILNALESYSDNIASDYKTPFTPEKVLMSIVQSRTP